MHVSYFSIDHDHLDFLGYSIKTRYLFVFQSIRFDLYLLCLLHRIFRMSSIPLLSLERVSLTSYPPSLRSASPRTPIYIILSTTRTFFPMYPLLCPSIVFSTLSISSQLFLVLIFSQPSLKLLIIGLSFSLSLSLSFTPCLMRASFLLFSMLSFLISDFFLFTNMLRYRKNCFTCGFYCFANFDHIFVAHCSLQ